MLRKNGRAGAGGGHETRLLSRLVGRATGTPRGRCASTNRGTRGGGRRPTGCENLASPKRADPELRGEREMRSRSVLEMRFQNSTHPRPICYRWGATKNISSVIAQRLDRVMALAEPPLARAVGAAPLRASVRRRARRIDWRVEPTLEGRDGAPRRCRGRRTHHRCRCRSSWW